MTQLEKKMKRITFKLYLLTNHKTMGTDYLSIKNGKLDCKILKKKESEITKRIPSCQLIENKNKAEIELTNKGVGPDK